MRESLQRWGAAICVMVVAAGVFFTVYETHNTNTTQRCEITAFDQILGEAFHHHKITPPANC